MPSDSKARSAPRWPRPLAPPPPRTTPTARPATKRARRRQSAARNLAADAQRQWRWPGSSSAGRGFRNAAVRRGLGQAASRASWTTTRSWRGSAPSGAPVLSSRGQSSARSALPRSGGPDASATTTTASADATATRLQGVGASSATSSTRAKFASASAVHAATLDRSSSTSSKASAPKTATAPAPSSTAQVPDGASPSAKGDRADRLGKPRAAQSTTASHRPSADARARARPRA
mmetsp:Transcript_3847/g.12826  ORF Transcript_3847/g.12826 Transcript_3847/m.12826 type:complete len:234 (-) Transcript_3847:95-796(-)